VQVSTSESISLIQRLHVTYGIQALTYLAIFNDILLSETAATGEISSQYPMRFG
jgi:hypothetical protein